MTDAEPGLFTRAGLLMLHERTHEQLALVFRHAGTLAPDAFVKELPGFGKGCVRDQLVHIVNCEQGWMHRLQDKPWTARPRGEYASADIVERARALVAAETRELFQRWSEERINTRLAQPPRDWGGTLRSPAFALLHVITHAFHHKGQIVAMCRLLGAPAPESDLQD